MPPKTTRRRPQSNRPGLSRSKASDRNTLRVIGGLWRGRKLNFPDVPGLRPTSDRVRETLFNWLQPWVQAEDCLDLFAGSGACGFEALSRGARSVVFIDAARQAVQAIEQNLQTLAGTPGYRGQAMAYQDCAEHWLTAPQAGGRRGFGLVFMDPPFAAGVEEGLLVDSCRQLEDSGLLKPTAHIYLESGKPLPVATPLPDNWRQIKQKRAGSVFFALYERAAKSCTVSGETAVQPGTSDYPV